MIELAEAVARVVPGTKISVNPHAMPDKRSYRVDFSMYARLAPQHQPQIDLDRAVRDLCSGLNRTGFRDKDFRSSSLIRLRVLASHLESGRLDSNLMWAA